MRELRSLLVVLHCARLGRLPSLRVPCGARPVTASPRRPAALRTPSAILLSGRAECVQRADALHRRGRSSWYQVPSTLFDDTASSATLDHLKAQAAPTHPGAQPERRGGLPWLQELASGRP